MADKSKRSIFIDFHGDVGPRYKVYWMTKDGKVSREITSPDFPHPKQVRYFDSKAKYVLLGGARGGGKTEAIIWDHIFLAHLVPGSYSLIMRRTIGELLSTIIERMQEMPVQLVGTFVAMQSNKHFLLPNGSKIRFASAATKEDVRKYLSGEYLRASFDEWSEWPLDMWQFVSGSVRSTKNKDIYGHPVSAQVKGGSNPGGEGGDALNHLFGCDAPKSPAIGMDPDGYDPDEYEFIPSLVDDNPAYSADTRAGRDYRKMLMSQPPARRDAWLLGKWTGFEGQYFDVFSPGAVKIPRDEVVQGMDSQRHQPVWMSVDFGKVHHSYVAWHTFLEAQLENGQAVKLPVTYREYLVKELSEAALAAEIADRTPMEERKRITNIYLSPELGSGSLSRAAQFGDIFITKAMPRTTQAFNQRENGWASMYKLLALRYALLNPWLTGAGEIVKECAGWLIDETCPYALEALPWASSNPARDGDIKAQGDSPLLDVLDGLRYGIASYIKPESQKPWGERVAEEMSRLPAGGSSRYIKWLKMRKEKEKEVAPYYTGKHTTFGERVKRRT